MKADLFVILAAVTSASHRCVIDVVSQVLDKERRGPHHPSSASLCSHWPAGILLFWLSRYKNPNCAVRLVNNSCTFVPTVASTTQ